jgi:hypothetical protein
MCFHPHKVSFDKVINKKLEVALEDKVYPQTYYHHIQNQIHIDETPTKVKV